MTESTYEVGTTPRLARWKIENMGLCTYISYRSVPFKIGKWNWQLAVEMRRGLIITLYPETSNWTSPPPIASFIITVILSGGNRKTFVHPEVTDKQLESCHPFVWELDITTLWKFIIDIEFLDLKIPSPSGGEPGSIWTREARQEQPNEKAALSSLGRMLSESIHTDIVINASNGSIGAHRAVLASRSPVFRRMFSHDLKEKELSTINISDMSIESCQAFLNYIYGNNQDEDFLTHRLEQIKAADKYDFSDLKEACHESLLEDIDTKNVLERLQNAHLFQLQKLKISCMRYLVNFGRIFDIKDQLNMFMQSGDRELIAEIFEEVLGAWKGFL